MQKGDRTKKYRNQLYAACFISLALHAMLAYFAQTGVSSRSYVPQKVSLSLVSFEPKAKKTRVDTPRIGSSFQKALSHPSNKFAESEIEKIDGSSKSTTHSELLQCAPTRVRKIKPHYPALAREMEVEGRVVISIDLTRLGEIRSAKIVKTLGYGCDESALNAVRQFQFEPATDLDGHAADCIFETEVEFRLD